MKHACMLIIGLLGTLGGLVSRVSAESPRVLVLTDIWRATWTGISGDRHYKNGPRHCFALVDNPWLEENVIRNHGPLGALYPKLAYIMEGDTPSFLGLIDKGLG